MPKILVIDDDDALREIIQLSLEQEGFEVIQADDGAGGVQLASAELPDLILCDVRMERMDGYRTLAALRQDSVTAPIPVILMTGMADTAGMRQGMELGADDYLSKPFAVPQLLAAVNARLRKHQTVREVAERKLAELRASISLALPHELLTPLNGILGFSDILISDHTRLQSGEIVAMSEAIRDSAKRLHRLIENFLIFAQIELLQADQLHSLREGRTPDARKPLERVARLRAERLSRSGDLVLDLSDAAVAMSEEYFTKIVDELLENAFKFSAPGSPVKVQSEPRDGWLVLRIADHGRGMKVEHIAEVGAYMQFERKIYEQQGSGLGLSVAKRLTELHQGELSIDSQIGVGTTVEVRLPRVPAPAPS
jgi:signal transduction histidine kinase